MAKVLQFPAGIGVHCYTPEMGQQRPRCDIQATLGHYGKHYYIDTRLELKGRGIELLQVYKSSDLTAAGQYKTGWNHYKVTERAFDKIQQDYSVSMERLLD